MSPTSKHLKRFPTRLCNPAFCWQEHSQVQARVFFELQEAMDSGNAQVLKNAIDSSKLHKVSPEAEYFFWGQHNAFLQSFHYILQTTIPTSGRQLLANWCSEVSISCISVRISVRTSCCMSAFHDSGIFCRILEALQEAAWDWATEWQLGVSFSWNLHKMRSFEVHQSATSPVTQIPILSFMHAECNPERYAFAVLQSSS